jgi:hypothetical protein
MESVPFGDALGGLFFNPAYLADLHGRDVLRVSKQRSLLESSFRIEKLADFSGAEEELLLASVIMMVLLERGPRLAGGRRRSGVLTEAESVEEEDGLATYPAYSGGRP